MQRRTFLLAGAALAAVAVAGVSGCSSNAAGTDNPVDRLTLAEGTEPASLSPLAAMYGLADKFYEGLFTIWGDGQLQWALADADAIPNSANTRWEVRLAGGHRFSTGEEVTPADVVATYRAIIDPAVGSPLAGHFSMLKDVTAKDWTIAFELSEPYAGFDTLLTVGIAPAALVAQPVDTSPLVKAPVGSGPYQLADWRAGDSLVLEPNPHYRLDIPIKHLVIVFVPDQNAVLQRAAAGSVQGAQIAPALAVTFDRPGWQVWRNASADVRAMTFPRNHPGMADPRVRRALNLAVNREAILSGVQHGYGTVADTPFTAAQGEVFNPEARFAYDRAGAEALLDEAGWPRTADGNRANAEGTSLGFRLMYFADDVARRDLAVAVAGELAVIGVPLEVVAVPYAQVGARIPDDALLFAGGDMPYHPDQHISPLLDSSTATFDPAAPFRNPSGYANPRIDELLQIGRESFGDQRTQAYREIQQLYLEDPALLCLIAIDHVYIAAGLDQWLDVQHVTEPHEHGAAWGPWRTIQSWLRK